MSVNIGITTVFPPFSYTPCLFNLIKSSNGTLFLFSKITTPDYSRLYYKSSVDNGATWDGSWTAVEISVVVTDFDVIIDTSDNIYVLYYPATGTLGLYLIKLAYSGGSWSVGSRKLISGSSGLNKFSLIKRSTGEIFVTAFTTGKLYGLYSNDDGDSWSSSYLSIAVTIYNLKTIEKDSTLWCILNTSTNKLIYHEWDDSGKVWNSGIEIVSSNVSVFGNICKISDSEIYCTIIASDYTVKVFKFTSSWDSGTGLSSSAQNFYPSMQNIGGRPCITWVKSDGANYNIVYRFWTGSVWDIETEIYNSGTTQSRALKSCIYDTQWLYIDWFYGNSSPYTIYFDKVQLITSTTVTKTITSDAIIEIVGEKLIISDAEINIPYRDIISDAKIHVIGNEKTILADAKIVIQALYDMNNKISFVKQVLSNINNKVNTVKRTLKDINNYINTVKISFYNINNDFRTKKQLLYDVINDVRFIKSWQKSATYGFQSLGKSYIRIYIGGVEQTDADIDSGKIFKALNQSHTFSFDLGRVYDGTKPTIESEVEIKYNDWTLYWGYITSIIPSDNPESMTINCQDKYWQQNKTKKYFRVGHKPIDDRELYYETIKIAILAELSWTLSIGNFVPEIIDCFGSGNSDALTNLITNCGNYGWFYDIDGTKKLWEAGNGSIIDIQRQTIGTNLGLYQLIEHKFTDDVNELVNKLRVQMGDRIVRKFNTTGGQRVYSGYVSSYYQGYVTPAWDYNYEILSKNNILTGYGWDAHKPEHEYLYKDIYKKYSLPYLNSALESWSDWKQPQVYIYGENLFNCKEGLLETGYTIDYENRCIVFNDRLFSYTLDDNGECISTRAPKIKVMLWKRKYYSSTASSSENPETDESSPLIFITDKMGSYSDIIFSDLNLSQFSIQEGGTYIDGSGVTQVIPSWDDTDFAKNYADWQLSKTCDKKIKGTIQLTLDAVCFYNIDLTKRINIDGITDSPMNIISMNYDINNFIVTLELENSRSYERTESLPTHGE